MGGLGVDLDIEDGVGGTTVGIGVGLVIGKGVGGTSVGGAAVGSAVLRGTEVGSILVGGTAVRRTNGGASVRSFAWRAQRTGNRRFAGAGA